MTIQIKQETDTSTKVSPLWNVILHDDPNHTFYYVIELIMYIFGRTQSDAEALTEEVHRMGRAIVITCSKERAELYLEQVKNYGDDAYIKFAKGISSGPLIVSIEPER
jgi:ATP-dependent Clp protease adaptor protein ClpS